MIAVIAQTCRKRIATVASDHSTFNMGSVMTGLRRCCDCPKQPQVFSYEFTALLTEA
jgi:hypothetical protein